MPITKKKVEKNNVESQKELFDILDKQFNAYFTPEKYRTDILPLDEVLGGYLESGSLIELSGESGCGKSTVLLHLLKNLAEKGLKSVYIDAEGSVKDSMLEGIGLTPYVSTREHKDNMFTLVRESGYETVEQLLSTFLKVGGYKVFVIDSLTALTGDVYLDLKENRQSTEGRVGFDSQMNSRILKKLNALKTKYNCIFIVISQTRLDMSNPYMSSYKATGGQASKFYPDIRLFMKVKEKLKEKRDLLIGKGLDTIIGANCTIEAHKSRLGPGFIPYPMTIYFGKGVSNLAAYVSMLPNLKNKKGHYVYEQASNVSHILHLDSGDVKTTKGKDGLNQIVVEHADEIDALCRDYMDSYFAQFRSDKTTSSDYDVRDDLIVEEHEIQDYQIDDQEDTEVE
jgi:RecA/RadA recombinase